MSGPIFKISEGPVASVVLDRAVLVYRGASGGAFATVHAIHQPEEGPPVILPGRSMTPLAVARLARQFTRGGNRGGFVPPELLYQDAATIAWWAPPRRRPVWFRCEALGAAERCATVPHPGLVFAVSSDRSWRVWAVKGGERPGEATPLHQAPYFNVYDSGAICQGNVEVPAGTTADRIDGWNRAFFGSYFTHPNVRHRLVDYEGGSHAFWRDLLDGVHAEFPEGALVPLDRTLAQMLARGDRHAA